MDTLPCRSAWDRFVRYRQEMKRPFKSRDSQESQLRRWSDKGPDRFCAAIDYTIAQGWLGLREEDRQADGANGRKLSGDWLKELSDDQG